MKQVFQPEPGYRHEVQTADGKVRGRLVVNDDALVKVNRERKERNRDIDLGAFQPGLKASWGFDWPVPIYLHLRQKHPDLLNGLRDKDAVHRELCAQKLARMYPGYVIKAPRGYHFTGR